MLDARGWTPIQTMTIDKTTVQAKNTWRSLVEGTVHRIIAAISCTADTLTIQQPKFHQFRGAVSLLFL